MADRPGLFDMLGQTWPARMAKSAWEAAKLPGDVYAGRVDPLSDEGIGRAADLGGLVMGGSFAGAPAGAVGAGPVKRIVRSSTDDPYQALDATFKYGQVAGNRMMPIGKLGGGVASQAVEEARVKALADALRQPDSYISRLLVDDAGSVVEGQHRLEALRLLGEKTAPVTVLRDLGRGFDIGAMEAAVKSAGNVHPDQVKGIVQGALEAIAESGSPAKALGYEIPGWQKHFEAAVNAAKPPKKAETKIGRQTYDEE